MTRCKINNEKMVIKGIDEIPMFSWNTETKEFYVLGHKFDGVNSIEDFVNFIYNLQQENEKLKEKNTIYKYTIKGQHKKIEELKNTKRISKKVHKKRNKKLQEENEKLNHYKLLYQKVKDRNDRAIEYLEDWKCPKCDKDTMRDIMFSSNKENALEILKGNNEE